MAANRTLEKVCVFCGSSLGVNPAYMESAKQVGEELAQRNIELVYGGGSTGLMGAVAKAVLEKKGRVSGIIPEALMDREASGEMLGDCLVVSSMHQRKQKMSEMADAFIVLPGGFGTMDEFMEILTWAQLGIHSKPIGLLNVCGFYNKLIEFIDGAVQDGFVREENRKCFVSSSDPVDLIESLKTMECPSPLIDSSKWDTKV